jgi:outer membrane protein assembly factor BamB
VTRRPVAVCCAAVMLLAGCSGSSGGSRSSNAGTPPGTAPPASGGSSAPPTSGTDWPNYHGDPAHSGNATNMPAVHGTPRVVARVKLDGQVYASPIVAGGVTFVATENDTVYALDRSYRQVWQRRLGTPSPQEERQCGDISPLGITGTPIYQDGVVYVVAELAGNVRHELFALDAATGKVKWSRGVDLPGVSARDMQQRGALAVANGRVWVSYGAQAGDCGDYKGRVVGVNLDGTGDPVFYSPPTQRGGGIWNPGGPTRLPNGDLLVVSANGAAFPGDVYDHTNSVLRLDGDAHLVDSFAPSDWAQNNQGDVGLGSQGPALVGDRWAVLGGKSGPVYVLRQDHLGGIGGQVSVKDICPSYGGAAVDGNVVYLPCEGSGDAAVRVDSHGQLHVLWHADASLAGAPVVGGGRVWALDQHGGVLHALDPKTGKTSAQVDVGETSRFATPAITGPDVLVPTLAGLTVVRTS